jgi:hypothetical protein
VAYPTIDQLAQCIVLDVTEVLDTRAPVLAADREIGTSLFVEPDVSIARDDRST